MTKKGKRESPKGFGKSAQPNLKNAPNLNFDRILSGDEVLICGRMQDADGCGGDIITTVPVAELKPYWRVAYDQSCSNKQLGLRRQMEQGRGMLSLMDAEYRKACGIDDSEGSPIVFNWYTLAELKEIERYSILFNNTNLLKSFVLWLVQNCNKKTEFPVLWNGVPINEESASKVTEGRCNLLFVVNSESSPIQKYKIYADEKFI